MNNTKYTLSPSVYSGVLRQCLGDLSGKERTFAGDKFRKFLKIVVRSAKQMAEPEQIFFLEKEASKLSLPKETTKILVDDLLQGA